MYNVLLAALCLSSTPANAAVNIKEKTDIPSIAASHGLRMGMGYINVEVSEHDLLRSPWVYLLGYEANQVLETDSLLNFLFVQNISVVGLNQSLFIPSGNVLFGFEINERFQVASGGNFTPTNDWDDWAHMIVAVGWTPRAGTVNVPFHFAYVPDVNNKWRTYLTTGVNW